jgi:hypothetical protein
MATALLWAALAAAQQSPNAVTINGIYFDNAAKTCSPNVNQCELLFTVVPLSKVLVIQRVACVLALPSTAKIGGITLRRKVDNVVTSFQVVAPYQEASDNGGTKNYLVNADTLLALQTGARPSIFVGLRASVPSMNVSCTIHGTLAPAT